MLHIKPVSGVFRKHGIPGFLQNARDAISLNQNLATGESGNEEECHIQYLQKEFYRIIRWSYVA